MTGCRVDNPFCRAHSGLVACRCADADNPEVAARSKPQPSLHEREGMIGRLVAHHENSFAQLAMDQARLLRDELPDRVTMEALNRMMARHAAILAELRR